MYILCTTALRLIIGSGTYEQVVMTLLVYWHYYIVLLNCLLMGVAKGQSEPTELYECDITGPQQQSTISTVNYII